ncbi:MAG: aldo/keto reductase [Vicinamibacterales bacterium]
MGRLADHEGAGHRRAPRLDAPGDAAGVLHDRGTRSRAGDRTAAGVGARRTHGLEPLAGGLLSGKFTRDGTGPDGARRAAFDFPPVNRDRAFDCVDAMRAIGEAHGISVARVALAWLLHRPVVMSVIIGAKSPEQLDDNLAAVDVRLSDEELARLDAVSALPPEYPGWMIARQAEAAGVPGTTRR